MLELLFGRLPAALHSLALKRVARFSLGSTLPSVNGETGALVSAASYASPAEAAQQLLAPLLSQDFALESGGSRVEFHGGRPAHPCAWMNEVLAPGAHASMRGRGGIRCRALSSGTLQRGPAVLVSPVPLDPEQAGVPNLLRPSRLP